MKRILMLNIMAWILLGCSGQDKRYREINEEQLKIQVILPQGKEKHYAVRVFPGEAISQLKGDQSKEMLYRTDSSFYLQTTTGKQYPLYTEPIASGIKGCYEYMVYFEEAAAKSFVYNDRYFTEQEYRVGLE